MADSIISHMSSVDGFQHDAFEDDFSYVPCFTLHQARIAFRDTVLGLEYLHYEGIVHRDIKPANLLWTKDHRVKISDFGVSYFGRPIREGETEENISEAEATDFDDDLELAKTVGTPAFFAPELCYTDLDIEQPKITEQIDVWSLGITLYCLIFARIPFLADDEYQLFRRIAKEDVYIPKLRLKAIDPNATTVSQNPIKRVSHSPAIYREESHLEYEAIDDELYDLLKRMLRKDPVERMKLREVKRHPWVLKGISNIIGWLDDTDPSRKTAGRRIEVDRNELERAVVPITFLERARSAVKKAVGKVIGATRSETRGEGSRRRAASNATSSGNDTQYNSPITPGLREGRRASLRGDESLFTALANFPGYHHRETSEHPLAQSVTASPNLPTHDEDPFALDFARQTVSVGDNSKHVPCGTSDPDTRPDPPARKNSTATSIQTVLHRGHSYSRSVNTPTTSAIFDDGPLTPGPFTDHMGAILNGHLWQRGRDMADIEEGIAYRARSVDRSLFESENKHSEPSLAMSTATAPGLFQHALNSPIPLKNPRPLSRASTRSVDVSSPRSRAHEKPLPSPQFFQFNKVHAYQQSASSPDVRTQIAASNLEERPSTANRTPEGKTPPPRTCGVSTPKSFQQAKEAMERRQMGTEDAELKTQQEKELADANVPAQCPPSPDDDKFMRKQEAARRAQSYTSVNSTSMTSQTTSPSPQLTSPISSVNLGSSEQMFTSSVQSLPALTSSASSVSADTQNELSLSSATVRHSETRFTAINTANTLTPPLLSKQVFNEGETPIASPSYHHALSDDEGYNGEVEPIFAHNLDDDSDSDEGLTMTRRKPKAKSPPMFGKLDRGRRDTNASIGSTETAKKFVLDH
jgi:[calcium/calmodulin-dependent protein kinase] kinase